MDLVVAAFNAHWGVGRFRPFRGVRFDVAEVVRGFDADVVVVPEAWRDDDGKGSLDLLTGEGYSVETVAFMPLVLRRDRSGVRDGAPRTGTWELAICTRLPVVARREISLGRVAGDPVGERPALGLTIDAAGTAIDVIGVHTSSRVHTLAPVRHLRRLQRQLPDDRPLVLAGDFNFWGPPVGLLHRGWERPVRGRTYPAHRPHSQIDHVLVRGGLEVVTGEVLDATPSDHRPVRTRLRLSGRVS